jgi:hypothetical protein
LVEWAEAHIDRGEAGDIKKATELLEAASNIYDRLAIPLYSERVGKLLQALRAEVSPKGI